MVNIRALVADGPVIMGVINCSPNSFYAPVSDIDAAIRQAEQMVAEGAKILDIGGEATNPAVHIEQEAPSSQAEIERVVPVIEAVKQRLDVAVSVDTSQPKVMQAAMTAGVDMINDQRALQLPGALQMVSHTEVAVCLMHIPVGRNPGSGSLDQFLNLVKDDLLAAANRCMHAGIERDRIVIDPGFGQGNFAKNLDENYYLLAHLDALVQTGFPVLSGWSRKSMIGDVLGGVPPLERLYGSVASVVLAAAKGASIIRVHDVKASHDALVVWQKMQQMEI